jgi:hypothetical protein
VTVTAIATTVACASAPVTGAGLAACGVAAGSAVAAVQAWDDFRIHTGTVLELKTKALVEMQKLDTEITILEQQLSAASAQNIKNNYSHLFLAICRAVREQCL